jgi:ferredoxin
MKNKIRTYSQFLFLLTVLYVGSRPLFDKKYLADFEKYCPFGGVSSLLSKINNGAMACNMNETQVFLGISLILTVGFIGKLFCSFVCPIGTVSEWIGKLGDKLRIRKNIPDKLDRYLRLLKYVLLFVTVYFTMTSNELFCKVFDPYFFSANLFNNPDIVLYYAIPAFILTIGGALFFRLFWCKYLCPLGALSNIFMNVAASGSVIIIYLVANYFGAKLSLVWLLGGLVLAGILNEVIFKKSFLLPFPKIKIANSCTNCSFCNTKCPQGINISELKVVNHIDCNLCTDCIYSCPKKNVLTINKSKNLKYLAPITLVVVIALVLVAANFYELTTISLRWGKPFGTGTVYTQTGLKNIKCYGSSMTLATALENIEGIYGLDTYAKSHIVKVYYDPSVISEKQVKESLFTHGKIQIVDPGNNLSEPVGTFIVGIYGLFDQLDFDNLYYLLKEKNGVYGFETQFGEPVLTTIYFNPSLISQAAIQSQIEKEFVYAKNERVDLNFQTDGTGKLKENITVLDFKNRMFNSYDEQFNSYENYKPEQLSVLKFSMPEADDLALRESLAYLVSHLSGNEGIVRFSTLFDGTPSCYIYFDPAKTTAQVVKKSLTQKKLKVFISETETEERENPFHINPEGKIIKAIEVSSK